MECLISDQHGAISSNRLVAHMLTLSSYHISCIYTDPSIYASQSPELGSLKYARKTNALEFIDLLWNGSRLLDVYSGPDYV